MALVKDVWHATAISANAVLSSTEVFVGGVYVTANAGNTSPSVTLRNGSTGSTQLRVISGNTALASIPNTEGIDLGATPVYFSAGCFASVSSAAIASVVFKEPTRDYR